MNKLYVLSLAILLTSCTISMVNMDTHGTASDVIDETQAPSTTASPELSLPAF